MGGQRGVNPTGNLWQLCQQLLNVDARIVNPNLHVAIANLSPCEGGTD